MEKIIQWGVIGSGGIARRRTIPEGIKQSEYARLISVFDIDQEVNKAVAKEFKATAAVGLLDFLESGIDAVYIATPVIAHREHVEACASAGKHILCEKPLGITVEDAEKILSACSEHNVLLGTGLMMRFHSQHLAARKLIEEGQLGKPVCGRAQLSCWYPPIRDSWRQDPSTGGGGSLVDMGSHCIDLLEMFFGKIISVNCYIRNNVHDYQSEDSAVVTMMFDNGALGTVDSYFCIPDNSSKNRLELYGSKGSILAEGTIGQGSSGQMVAYLEDDQAGYDARQKRDAAEGTIISPEPVNTYKAEIDDFSMAILEKRSPLNDAGVGLRNQQILAACYESASKGKTIRV